MSKPTKDRVQQVAAVAGVEVETARAYLEGHPIPDPLRRPLAEAVAKLDAKAVKIVKVVRGESARPKKPAKKGGA